MDPTQPQAPTPSAAIAAQQTPLDPMAQQNLMMMNALANQQQGSLGVADSQLNQLGQQQPMNPQQVQSMSPQMQQQMYNTMMQGPPQGTM